MIREFTIKAVLLMMFLAAGPGVAWTEQRSSGGSFQTIPLLETQTLRDERERLDKTVWAQEVLAQEYEQTFVALWDDLLAGQDPYERFAAFPFNTIQIGQPTQTDTHDWGITVTHFGKPLRSFNMDTWKEFLNDMKSQQFRILETEWHHSKFHVIPGETPESAMNMLLLVENKTRGEKYVIKGDLAIKWSDKKDSFGHYIPDVIDASGVLLTSWKGPTVFKEMLTFFRDDKSTVPSSARKPSLVVLAYDLNGDGLSEIICPGLNRMYWNRGKGVFEPVSLRGDGDTSIVTAGLIADLTGDGLPDLLCAVKQPSNMIQPLPKALDNPLTKIVLYPGTANGQFAASGKEIFGNDQLLSVRLLTSGDIDGDGDLDIFFGQTRKNNITLGGVFPKYYDANDAYPSFLLRNDGNGVFIDVTEPSGLAPKRFRRAYSASFVDINDDGTLDLFTSSDFAGADMYVNDGHGHFTDVTDTALDDRMAFGMGHTFGDYDLDGRLDMFMTGMSSTTARRLDDMKLERSDLPDIAAMRGRMGYGNRMYLAKPDHTFAQPSFKDHVARAGWTWGSTSFDFDSDGDPDIFVGNGNDSLKTTKDYCTTYWTHDVYDTNPSPGPATTQFINEVREAKDEAGISWDGYQHDKLFMNEAGKDFLEIGFLMDVSFQDDTHAVLSDDFDADGRPDLLVATKPAFKSEKVVVYHNEWPVANHWIGVRLKDEPGRSPIGARITVGTPSGPKIGRIVTGDSFYAQHSNLKNFGLGQSTQVDSVEVKWLDGTVVKLDHPAVDRYYDIRSTPTNP